MRFSRIHKKPTKTAKCSTIVLPNFLFSLSQHDLMATVRLELRKKVNKDGTRPLSLRITKDRKSTYLHLGQNLDPQDWDDDKQRVRKSHPNSVRLNHFLLKKIAEANDKLLELESQSSHVTSKVVRRNIKSGASGISFFECANIYLENFKLAGKYNRITTEKSRIKRLKEFTNGRDISFQELNVAMLNQFRAWLQGKHKASERSVVNHLIVIRTIFNIGIESYGLDRKHYPFGKGKIQIRIPQSLKIGLDIEEVKAIENLDLSDQPYLDHCRNIWLYSFYFAGMRIGDVLRSKWDDFKGERLYYKMGKNDKPDSLKIPDKAEVILQKYIYRKDQGHVLVFPELDHVADLDNRFEVERQTSFKISLIDDGLKKIAKKAGIEKILSMHIARHTFGNISGEKIPLKMLQKLYRHSSITTTIGYQANFIHKEADEALDSVINF